MAIAKKPNRNHLEIQHETAEDAAEKFISGADAARNEAPEEGGKKVPIMIRCDPALLHRVDAAAKHRGISRSAWIQFTLSRALDQGEG